MEKIKEAYRTKDFYEASCLYALNQKLVKLESEGNNKFFWFVFNDGETCKKIVDLFWRKECQIDAKAFCDSIRSLKDLIFSQR